MRAYIEAGLIWLSNDADEGASRFGLCELDGAFCKLVADQLGKFPADEVFSSKNVGHITGKVLNFQVLAACDQHHAVRLDGSGTWIGSRSQLVRSGPFTNIFI